MPPYSSAARQLRVRNTSPTARNTTPTHAAPPAIPTDAGTAHSGQPGQDPRRRPQTPAIRPQK
eukprot:12295202-Alexandrium_andersonii.AAC.1